MDIRDYYYYCNYIGYDQYNNRVDVRGHKYVFGPTQNHFSPSVARVKMSFVEGQKHIYAQEHQLYYYYNNFKGLVTLNFNFVFQKNNYTYMASDYLYIGY